MAFLLIFDEKTVLWKCRPRPTLCKLTLGDTYVGKRDSFTENRQDARKARETDLPEILVPTYKLQKVFHNEILKLLHRPIGAEPVVFMRVVCYGYEKRCGTESTRVAYVYVCVVAHPVVGVDLKVRNQKLLLLSNFKDGFSVVRKKGIVNVKVAF